MTEPFSVMAMAAMQPQQLDKARSVIVADLLRGILAARPGSSRLAAVQEAADAAAGTAAAGSSSWSISKQQARLARTLAVPACSSSRHLIISQSCEPWQQQQLGGQADARSAQQTPLLLPPGLPLERQSVHSRRQVLLVLSVFQLLEAWGVSFQHDGALAAALQVRWCVGAGAGRTPY